MKVLKFAEFIKESLPQQNSVDQLKRVRALSKGTDIGDRIIDMSKAGANVEYFDNPIDTGIESYQDFMKSQEESESKKPLNNKEKVSVNYITPQMKNGYKKEK
jgi:antirestriction protein